MKVKDAYFIGKLIEKTETRYISHNGSPDSKIFALLRDTITDFNEEDLDDTLSFDVKEKKLVLYNFIEYSSPYKNGFSLTDYPFTSGKSFSKDLKKKMKDGEENPYTSLSVLVETLCWSYFSRGSETRVEEKDYRHYEVGNYNPQYKPVFN